MFTVLRELHPPPPVEVSRVHEWALVVLRFSLVWCLLLVLVSGAGQERPVVELPQPRQLPALSLLVLLLPWPAPLLLQGL